MRSGSLISQYEVGKLLGRGGMGEVYRAHDTRLDRPVALKFLNPGLDSNEEAKERFVREARAASALDHPNICTIHDYGETEDGSLYLVMALYEGETLDRRLERETFTPDRTLGILRQLASALKRAHEGGIVHRDLKPANVMVGADDAVRLLDFGVAKLQSAQSLTQTGSTLGTAAYMSPEQASADPVTSATDIWALGVVGYRMLTGRLPFEAENPLARLNQILTADVPPVRSLNREVPAELAAAVELALRKDVNERPADGGAFLELLGSGTTTGGMTAGSGPRSAHLAGRSASGRTKYLAAAGLAAIVALAAWWFSGSGGPSVTAANSSDVVIAVLPFSITGDPELQYLAEGLMDLVAGRLDGAGELRTVDTRAIVAGANLEPGEGIGADRGSVLAAQFGAASFVTGQLVGLPGGVSISARLHMTATGEERPVVTVEGSADSLFTLVDQLASGLLETSINGQNARIRRTAAATSNSIAATRAFLEGEQFHRAGQFDSAAVAYNRAVALDSTFAIAHLMKSMNNSYTYETDDLEAAERAMLYSEGLPDRDRSLISAFLDQQSGRLDEAEQKYLDHLRRWPDEVKAMFQLGSLYMRGNFRRGISMEPAFTYLERVLQYEPDNFQARHRLSRLDGYQRRFSRLPEHVEVLERIGPGTEWALEVRTMVSFALDDQEHIDELVETFPDQSLLVRLFAVYSALRFANDPHMADRLLDREDDAMSVSQESGLPDGSYQPGEVERLADYQVIERVMVDWVLGRYDNVRAFLANDGRFGAEAPAWVMWWADVVNAGVVPVDRSIVERTLARVEGVNPETRMDLAFERLHDVFTADVARLEQNEKRARLQARLGRMDEAWEIQRTIANGPTYRGFASLREDVAAGVAAELHHLAGDDERALELLRGIRFEVSGAANSLEVTNGAHSRFLRAELEMRMGDPEVARRLLEGLVGSFSTTDKLYLSEAYDRLGELNETLGRTEDAVYWTEKFVRAFTGADPDLQSRLVAAEARLERLRTQLSG